MSGLTNDYLEKLALKLLKGNKNKFIGVYSANADIKFNLRKPFSVIFNTDRLGSPGLHFISIYATTTKVYYFDSFGNKKIQRDILKFIQKLNRKCEKMCKPIQDKSSNFCGFYALAFLLWKRSKKKTSKFYDLFTSSNLKLNDPIVINQIVKEIKK